MRRTCAVIFGFTLSRSLDFVVEIWTFYSRLSSKDLKMIWLISADVSEIREILRRTPEVMDYTGQMLLYWYFFGGGGFGGGGVRGFSGCLVDAFFGIFLVLLLMEIQGFPLREVTNEDLCSKSEKVTTKDLCDSRFLSSGSVWRATNEDFCEILKDADPWKQGTVVLLLQDMFEVVTCDIMVNEICELVEFKRSKKDSLDKTDDIAFPPVVTAQWELGRTCFL
ncbi:hypothetical protein POM88_049607 [Heracleum sosnowskyi]|uniref:Callose synthase helical domain-containing protein n=1 Tax=Heracleum sosnowskyi TaxID=360622 RepID=A0AAD8GYR2_9APIA|nr:hypothetical protein POM88_049607 [Heracleum sosnowskyi]